MPAPSPTVTLILPGLYDSGPEHWQSWWVREDPSCVRVEQRDWATPRCDEWCARLDEAVASLASPTTPAVLVGHSTACALIAAWSATASDEQIDRVRGAMLVAPSDTEGPNYPDGPVGFTPMPLEPLRFPSIVVASDDDLYVTADRAREFAARWGSELVMLSGAGHINSASGLGSWPAGRALLDRLRSGSRSGERPGEAIRST